MSKGRYDETFAGEDGCLVVQSELSSKCIVVQWLIMDEFRKTRLGGRWVGIDNYFSHQSISDGRTNLPREAIGPLGSLGSNCFSRGSVHLYQYLRKSITTCDYSVGP